MVGKGLVNVCLCPHLPAPMQDRARSYLSALPHRAHTHLIRPPVHAVVLPCPRPHSFVPAPFVCATSARPCTCLRRPCSCVLVPTLVHAYLVRACSYPPSFTPAVAACITCHTHMVSI